MHTNMPMELSREQAAAVCGGLLTCRDVGAIWGGITRYGTGSSDLGAVVDAAVTSLCNTGESDGDDGSGMEENMTMA